MRAGGWGRWAGWVIVWFVKLTIKLRSNFLTISLILNELDRAHLSGDQSGIFMWGERCLDSRLAGDCLPSEGFTYIYTYMPLARDRRATFTCNILRHFFAGGGRGLHMHPWQPPPPPATAYNIALFNLIVAQVCSLHFTWHLQHLLGSTCLLHPFLNSKWSNVFSYLTIC